MAITPLPGTDKRTELLLGVDGELTTVRHRDRENNKQLYREACIAAEARLFPGKQQPERWR